MTISESCRVGAFIIDLLVVLKVNRHAKKSGRFVLTELIRNRRLLRTQKKCPLDLCTRKRVDGVVKEEHESLGVGDQPNIQSITRNLGVD